LQKTSDGLKAVVPLSARRALVKARLRARILTARFRLLPDFVIIGCQRGGTSSLYKYLGRHPEIAPSLRKETEFFTINHHLGESWYRAHFPLALRRAWARLLGRRLIAFEATPDYLLEPRAVDNLKRLLPDARIVVLLREPGERALSHYHHNVRLGHESETFSRALQLEDERIAPDIAELAENPDSRAVAFRRFSYATRGMYADQLERWLEAFPRDRVKILESEVFFDDPDRVLAEILEFVGARPWSPPEFRNYSYLQKDVEGHDVVPEPERSMLDARFAVPNEALRDMIGEGIRWLSNRD
jgi:hypothetical protein